MTASHYTVSSVQETKLNRKVDLRFTGGNDCEVSTVEKWTVYISVDLHENELLKEERTIGNKDMSQRRSIKLCI